jgi:translation initiation factor 1 (eIF-1/SUI1)
MKERDNVRMVYSSAAGQSAAVTDDGMTLQGDVREKVRELLSVRGFLVKG